MPKDKSKIIALKHEKINIAKPIAEQILNTTEPTVPRLTVDIINNRWRALSLHLSIPFIGIFALHRYRVVSARGPRGCLSIPFIGIFALHHG